MHILSVRKRCKCILCHLSMVSNIYRQNKISVFSDILFKALLCKLENPLVIDYWPFRVGAFTVVPSCLCLLCWWFWFFFPLCMFLFLVTFRFLINHLFEKGLPNRFIIFLICLLTSLHVTCLPYLSILWAEFGIRLYTFV